MANEAELSIRLVAESFGIVVGLSLGISVVAVLVIRKWRLPLIPHWQKPGVIWTGSAVLALFLAYYATVGVAIPALDSSGVFQALLGNDFPKLPEKVPENSTPEEVATRRAQYQVRSIWASFLVVPLIVALTLLLWVRVMEQPLNVPEFLRKLPGRVVFGLWTGLFLIPVTFAVHLFVNWLSVELGLELEKHPLNVLTPAGDGVGGVAFALSVILFGPLIEELLFRGLLVNWSAEEWYRPWLVMVFALLSVIQMTSRREPILFIALLAVGLYALQLLGFRVWPKFPTRTAAAIWCSAAIFAAMHSPVWPTPIPLFVLGLGLGYVTARTRDITAAVTIHGMFNAVSFVTLLRTGTG